MISYSLIGGKIDSDSLKKMLNYSYKFNNKDDTNINGYKIDKELSGRRTQVYKNDDKNHVIIAHRGTQDIHDVFTDLKLGLMGSRNNARFNHSKYITDKAHKKYGDDAVYTQIGHSLGAEIAKNSGDGYNDEVVTFNKAEVTPFEKQKDNEYHIRTSLDPISALLPYRFYGDNKNNNITINSKTNDLLQEHSLDSLDLSQLPNEIGK